MNPAIDWLVQPNHGSAQHVPTRRDAPLLAQQPQDWHRLAAPIVWQPPDKTDRSELGNDLPPPLFATKVLHLMQMYRAKSCYPRQVHSNHHHQHQSQLIPLQKFYGGLCLLGRKPNLCRQGCYPRQALLYSDQRQLRYFDRHQHWPQAVVRRLQARRSPGLTAPRLR